jgi:predicted transcriptional regulator
LILHFLNDAKLYVPGISGDLHTSQFFFPQSSMGGSVVAAKKRATKKAEPPTIPCAPIVSPSQM